MDKSGPVVVLANSKRLFECFLLYVRGACGCVCVCVCVCVLHALIYAPSVRLC